jgi:hypothetical protein
LTTVVKIIGKRVEIIEENIAYIQKSRKCISAIATLRKHSLPTQPRRREGMSEWRGLWKVNVKCNSLYTSSHNTRSFVLMNLRNVYASDRELRWRKTSLAGTESVEDVAKSVLPMTFTGKINVSKVS